MTSPNTESKVATTGKKKKKKNSRRIIIENKASKPQKGLAMFASEMFM